VVSGWPRAWSYCYENRSERLEWLIDVAVQDWKIWEKEVKAVKKVLNVVMQTKNGKNPKKNGKLEEDFR
jgi:hypothetical protein